MLGSVEGRVLGCGACVRIPLLSPWRTKELGLVNKISARNPDKGGGGGGGAGFKGVLYWEGEGFRFRVSNLGFEFHPCFGVGSAHHSAESPPAGQAGAGAETLNPKP